MSWWRCGRSETGRRRRQPTRQPFVLAALFPFDARPASPAEVKAVTAMLPVYQAQTLTYMRLAECPAGLLINFNVPKLMDGVKRLVNPRAS